MNQLLASGSPLDHVVWHGIFPLTNKLYVTNHMIMAGVAALLMLILFPWLFATPKPQTPTGIRNFFEAILQFLRDDVFKPSLREHADRFTPFLWTVFFYVLFCNLLGFIPLGEFFIVITGGHADKLAEIGGTATGNIATTAALAIAAFLFIHLNGIWQIVREMRAGTYHNQTHDAHGEHTGLTEDPHASHNATPHHATGLIPAMAMAPVLYIWNFAPHLFMPKKGESATGWLADLPIWGLLLVLELVGAMIKPFALCMRLFANMIAGHIVLAVLAGLIVLAPGVLAQIGIGIPVTAMSLMIRMLELFVCFLQAYIFTFLTTLFIAAAVAPEH